MGHLSNLLRVTVEESAEEAVRQVAAITLKNLVKNDWDCGKGSGFRGYGWGLTPPPLGIVSMCLLN
jgi:hypothetical protein